MLMLSLLMLLSTLNAKETISPKVADKFGEVFVATIEFVEKPKTYLALRIVDEPFFAKVKSINGKPLKESIVIEYRSDDKSFKKGETLILKAYEDVESLGGNEEWTGRITQISYRMRHFIHIKRLANE